MDTGTSIDKETLVAGLYAENQQWEELIGQIRTAQMDEPTVAEG